VTRDQQGPTVKRYVARTEQNRTQRGEHKNRNRIEPEFMMHAKQSVQNRTEHRTRKYFSISSENVANFGDNVRWSFGSWWRHHEVLRFYISVSYIRFAAVSVSEAK